MLTCQRSELQCWPCSLMGSAYGSGAPRHPSRVALIGRLPCSFRGRSQGPRAKVAVVMQCCVRADPAGPGSVSASVDDRGAAQGGLLPDVAVFPLASVHEPIVAVAVMELVAIPVDFAATSFFPRPSCLVEIFVVHLPEKQPPFLSFLQTCSVCTETNAVSFQPLAACSPRSPCTVDLPLSTCHHSLTSLRAAAHSLAAGSPCRPSQGYGWHSARAPRPWALDH